MSTYKTSTRLEALAIEIIRADMPRLAGCPIVYMESDKAKKNGNMIIYADAEKLTDKISALTGVDFVITFYKDAEDLTMTAHRILMEHELMHIGWEPGGTKKIVPHDVQDFAAILNKYGLQWHQTQQVSMFEEDER